MSDASPTREAALTELRRLAAGVHERTEAEATARFLERVTAAGDPERLRAALAEAGARALLLEARTQAVVAQAIHTGTRELEYGRRP